MCEYTEVFTPVNTQEPSQAGEDISPEPEAEPADTSEAGDEAPPAVVWSDRYKRAWTFLYGDDDTPHRDIFQQGSLQSRDKT